jgi:hypothetical protein
MAERLSTLPGAWSVAHYVELRGNLDPALLGRAIVTGLAQADTLSMRFCEDNGEAWQWVDEHRAFAEPDYCDLREARDPHDAALALMQADLGQNLRVDGGNPLVCHQLLRVADDCWYWYQRYHHLLVDGFSFPAITRQIAAIYRAWQRGEATPASPFTPFAEVVEEYQRYYGSEAWQRDKAFWMRTAQSPAVTGVALCRAAGGAGDQYRYLAPEAGSGCRPVQPPGRRRTAVSASRSGAGADHPVARPFMQPHGLCRGLYLYAADGLGGIDRNRPGTERPAAGDTYRWARDPGGAGAASQRPAEKDAPPPALRRRTNRAR